MPSVYAAVEGEHMIQASERWVYDRLGHYKTVTITTEYVSPEIGEILMRDKQGAIFSILLAEKDLCAVIDQCSALVEEMRTRQA